MAVNVLRTKVIIENKKEGIATFVTIDFSERYKLHAVGYAIYSSLFTKYSDVEENKFFIKYKDLVYGHIDFFYENGKNYKLLPRFSLQDLNLKIGDVVDFELITLPGFSIKLKLIETYEMPRYQQNHFPYIEDIGNVDQVSYIEDIFYKNTNLSFKDYMSKREPYNESNADAISYRNSTLKRRINNFYWYDYKTWLNTMISEEEVVYFNKVPRTKKPLAKKRLYSLLVTYNGMENKIYRRIKVYQNDSLVEVGNAINYYFRTYCYHLFSFAIDSLSYDFLGDYEPTKFQRNICKFKISDILKSVVDTCEYTYDYGTRQEFKITLEKIEYTTDPENSDIYFYPTVTDGKGRGIADDMPQDEFIELFENTEKSNKEYCYIFSVEDEVPSVNSPNAMYIYDVDIDDLKENEESMMKFINKNYKRLCN